MCNRVVWRAFNTATVNTRMEEENDGFRELDTPGPMRLTKYNFLHLTVPGLASILAWTGMVTSVIFTILSTDLLFIPLAVGSVKCHTTVQHTFICGVFYGAGVPGLLINVGFFIFSYKLWMKIKNKDLIGTKAFIKIGCYLITSLEMIFSALELIIPLYITANHVTTMTIYGYPISRVYVGVNVLIILVGIVCMVFTSTMVYGIRNFNLRYVNIYIIFKFVFLGLYILSAVIEILYIAFLLKRGVVGMIILTVNGFFITSFLYVFSMGFAVLQYNIMLN